MVSALRSLQGIRPRLGARVHVDPAAVVIGDVELADDVSIWPTAVLRGDVGAIRIGRASNIQDGAIIHVTHDGPWSPGGGDTEIGEGVTVGHGVVIHAARIEDHCLIGIRATILDGAIIHRHAIIAAGSLVPPGKVVGEGELWMGQPARRVRALEPAEIERLHYSAEHYVRIKDRYLAESRD
ncbi:gamma carbonic anhydrase family protein [Frateuria aurantia]|uniref:Isoleucine patch superfamily enzyme, carbonic anhydrase/acetyltransferase n=1 Tax=Frateuria aurantia (strain ATCC 33424 / DSM 6220 / KCTC 2777 / LMG 1558 / NBRC 3245 / NCIMB 13370) TaxID=767434 RepID=H8L3P6_FRAAD|nr:isoleucine patch superfamily enzyme, carbonic anhydrase/acetyltransferase [Frateuria aurantia DSM 6220]